MAKARMCVVLALFAAIGATSASGSPAAGQQGVAPFTYSFRVVEFSLIATLTYAKTAATIRYRLVKPSVEKSMFYLGARPTNRGAAWKGPYAGPLLDTVAEATYTSPDPSCTNKIQYKPAGNKVVQVFVELVPRIGAKRVSASVGRIPLAEPHPGEDGGVPDFSTKPRPRCGKPVMGSWYQDVKAFVPAGHITRPRVTLRGHDARKFTDPGIESVAWTLKVVLQRVSYRRIDCRSHPGC